LDGRAGDRDEMIETGILPGQQYVRISDNGPGVADDVRERIFDPFFTTKTEGTGTGVGLSVSRSIAREHGGELSLAHDEEQGASFLLCLPAGSGVKGGAARLATASDEAQPG